MDVNIYQNGMTGNDVVMNMQIQCTLNVFMLVFEIKEVAMKRIILFDLKQLIAFICAKID